MEPLLVHVHASARRDAWVAWQCRIVTQRIMISPRRGQKLTCGVGAAVCDVEAPGSTLNHDVGQPEPRCRRWCPGHVLFRGERNIFIPMNVEAMQPHVSLQLLGVGHIEQLCGSKELTGIGRWRDSGQVNV